MRSLRLHQPQHEIGCNDEYSIFTLRLWPVFHKKDMPCLAYLHLGILAYWVVATIRYQLKQKGYTKGWTQLVDIMDTQHSVATEMEIKGLKNLT